MERDEARTTRARANAAAGAVSAAPCAGGPRPAELRDVLGTCVACKACKTECPAGVDMAALKVEWLAELQAREGVPVLARGVGQFRRLAAWRRRWRRLSRSRAHPRRDRDRSCRRGPRAATAAFARRSLTRRLRIWRAAPAARAARAPRRHTAPPPALRRLLHPVPGTAVGEALARLLAAAGVRLTLVNAGCCGRTALSTGQIDRARCAAGERSAAFTASGRRRTTCSSWNPACQAMAIDDWSRLLPDDPRVAAVAASTRSALGLVTDLAAAGRLRFAGRRAILHPHCHERALWGAGETRKALRACQT